MNVDMLCLNPIPIRSDNIDKSMDFLARKQTGSYYTSNDLADVMISELVDSLPEYKKQRLYELRFLEPCVGEGSFVFAYLAASLKFGFSREEYRTLLKNIYVCDINPNALSFCRTKLSELAMVYFDIYLDDEYFNSHVKSTGLLFNLENSKSDYISIESAFGCGFTESFDIVATNPPYKILKAERKHYPSLEEYNSDKMRYSNITKQSTKLLPYSAVGINNIYKFFVEEILERYSTKDGVVSLLIPSSILTDKTCEKLRIRIFETASIKSIKTIGEESSVVDSGQALCALLIHKSTNFEVLEISQNYGSSNEKSLVIETEKAIDKNLGYSILILEQEDYKKLQILKSFPTIKELSFIVNMRGELDLTANKKSIVADSAGYPLLRGRNIGFYELLNTNKCDFVTNDFVSSTSKRVYIESERLICQQIANIAKERRLTFAIAPKNTVLGNSCNFISILDNEYDIDMYFMLGLLNSSIMNWFFKIQSSNNHINNYEIDRFPIPVNYNRKRELSELVRDYLADKTRTTLIDRIDELILDAFNLNVQDNNLVSLQLPNITSFDNNVKELVAEKNRKLSRGEILNHITFKLSDLDLEMVRAVPQGGNWKNIPHETVIKSKRLERITQTGGRTTLYGRIDYNKPSYTITTYFNRPGNGTYIHPLHDRVLSVREAARLQAFPDSYLFCGNKSQLLAQVGNAVPPLFAYQIAKKITTMLGFSRSVDLFCGAGGMTYGFKLAGIQSILSTDIEHSACLTLKVNSPEIPILCGDITHNDIKQKIIAIAKESGVDIINGGPPCQGFSMAGHRLSDDPRNRLFIDFIDIVRQVKPKVVIFENVEGLLSYQGGKTYRLIHDMFSEIGYNAEGKLMQMNLFAVPQKRKRVIIICVRNDINVQPSELYPMPITTETQITAYMAISDLSMIECGEDAIYDSSIYSTYVAMLKNEISPEEYIRIVSNSPRKSDNEVIQMTLFG